MTFTGCNNLLHGLFLVPLDDISWQHKSDMMYLHLFFHFRAIMKQVYKKNNKRQKLLCCLVYWEYVPRMPMHGWHRWPFHWFVDWFFLTHLSGGCSKCCPAHGPKPPSLPLLQGIAGIAGCSALAAGPHARKQEVKTTPEEQKNGIKILQFMKIQIQRLFVSKTKTHLVVSLNSFWVIENQLYKTCYLVHSIIGVLKKPFFIFCHFHLFLTLNVSLNYLNLSISSIDWTVWPEVYLWWLKILCSSLVFLLLSLEQF